MRLNEVFGIATEVSPASYVNRGGLDERLGYYLATQRHIAIHGDSKQGKTWLRARLLDSDDTIVVQCQVETTPESLFREALGFLDVHAELRRTGRAQLEGTLDFRAGGQLGNALLGKVELEGSASGTTGRERETETEPIGKTPGDLAWVARTIRASEKRLVIEDFHYVTEDNRRAFAFMLKALGDYGVNVIVVGVWPEDHLLTYYNGDLDGRV
jgi:AAA domain